MKIRTGFVSNSSSSSFIVQIRDSFKKQEFIIPEKDIEKVIQFGFKIFNNPYPHNIKYDSFLKGPKIDSIKDIGEKDNFLSFYITCNEDEVIWFLLKNNISFKASVHYDHYYYEFLKDSKYLYIYPNVGNIVCMYGKEYIQKSDNKIKKISVKKYLKENDNEI